jgi:hypothetical protein
VRDVVNFRVCELAIALWLIVVECYKSKINSIPNPNPMSSQHMTVFNLLSASFLLHYLPKGIVTSVNKQILRHLVDSKVQKPSNPGSYFILFLRIMSSLCAWLEITIVLVIRVHIQTLVCVNTSCLLFQFLAHIIIFYNVRVLDQFWPPVVPCYATEDAFRLLIGLFTIPIHT